MLKPIKNKRKMKQFIANLKVAEQKTTSKKYKKIINILIDFAEKGDTEFVEEILLGLINNSSNDEILAFWNEIYSHIPKRTKVVETTITF
jgi:hypothetical protein